MAFFFIFKDPTDHKQNGFSSKKLPSVERILNPFARRVSFDEFFMKKIHYASNFSVNVRQPNQRDQIMVVI